MGIDLGFRKMLVEGDARSIIRKLQREEDDRSVISAYIKDSTELSKKDNKRGGHLSEGRVPDFVVAEAEHDRN
ncbi:hypothetical protein Goarm_017682, partial [Gossypium armourianum]|nr:hypothetical protein [Gossypium armourianum]